MKNLEVRKIIALGSFAVMAIVVLVCMFRGIEVPPSVNAIITIMAGWIGFYYGKSTALEGPKKDGE